MQRSLAALLPAMALASIAGAQERPRPAQSRPMRLSAASDPREKSQEELIKERDEKLAKAVFKKAPWITDYDKARAESRKTGKPIFAYFTRSYAP